MYVSASGLALGSTLHDKQSVRSPLSERQSSWDVRQSSIFYQVTRLRITSTSRLHVVMFIERCGSPTWYLWMFVPIRGKNLIYFVRRDLITELPFSLDCITLIIIIVVVFPVQKRSASHFRRWGTPLLLEICCPETTTQIRTAIQIL